MVFGCCRGCHFKKTLIINSAQKSSLVPISYKENGKLHTFNEETPTEQVEVQNNGDNANQLQRETNRLSLQETGEPSASNTLDTFNSITSSLTPSNGNEVVENKQPVQFAPALKKQRAPPIPNGQSSEEFIANDTESQDNVPVSKEEQKKSIIDIDGDFRERREGIAPVQKRVDQIMEKLPVYIKDPSDEDTIRRAIRSNDFLNQIITDEKLNEVIISMYNKEISAKEVIIKQGDKGSHMYVSAKGTFQIIVNGKVFTTFNDTRVFGELALLYNAKRQATVKAVSSGRVWVLDNNVYQQIMIRDVMKKQDELMKFLLNNKYLKVVGEEALKIVSNLLKSEFFKSNEVIVKQGDRGDKFFIIRAGTVTITKKGEGVVNIYKQGDCFGELALLEEDCRQATVTANAPGVECLTLTRKQFIDHLGEIKQFKYIKIEDRPKESINAAPTEYDDINLKDLRIVKTIGVGGFGRVELVQHTTVENIVFALKYLKKIAIVEQNQQEHIYNEKDIQLKCRSPLIVRLFRTYKDRKFVYFLMEACLGGDLWSLLHRQKNRKFEEKEARFICGCVLEAFDYLHSRGIVYRDLKPENLLISSKGYIKLTDFGFAKKIENRSKTFTFAGTPEYVAPEIVLGRGHDRAVDYWAYGVFVFEMLCGKTPFRSDDHMRTYQKILNGIDTVAFPTYIPLSAKYLIERLCRAVPSERLGMKKNGIQDIKGHKWFMGMDWQKLVQGGYHSPFKPKLNGPVDTKYFDNFKPDNDKTPEENSGWDNGF
ncbi:unnamed protein product [Phyllotreta striolata]|uniref:cGMP-dependent protein kinase n=1 Tax=Phyllotreta striolata TaxID=444603 RepID=A0A9N9T9S8_PHYSR|nr:unnamed protein product [Phyllotreta striolata]